METVVVKMDFAVEAKCVVRGCPVRTTEWFAFHLGNLWAGTPICKRCQRDYLFGMKSNGKISYERKKP
jgi:hypothetical protein